MCACTSLEAGLMWFGELWWWFSGGLGWFGVVWRRFGGGLAWFGDGLGWFGVFWGGLGCFNGPQCIYIDTSVVPRTPVLYNYLLVLSNV